MFDLLAALLRLLAPIGSLRAILICVGLLAFGSGAMIFAGRTKGPILALAVLLVAGGVGLIVVAIALPARGGSSRGSSKPPPPDDWRPPDAADIDRVIRGR
jgi:hypothetical protein